ncbi:MAG: aspartate dehydrogenase [Roseobacter sp.]|jgi:aspartate dehydrogenase|nr:aspartate dehydrogenase [Roseobacter sp.]
MRPVGIIGYGAIAQAVCSDFARQDPCPLLQVLVRKGKAAAVEARLPKGMRAVECVAALDPSTALVVECAGHGAVRSYGGEVLARGTELAIVSSGVLADAALLADLKEQCVTHGARLRVLSGAIGGIDALAAAGDRITHVRYVARKPPTSWRGSPADATHDLDRIDTATAVFEGSARDAALGFPKNANVVATVALAGIGFDHTEVSLIADPAAQGNSHEIIATGNGFDLHYITTGAALPQNPRTSALTALSVVRALRQTAPGLAV